MVVVAGGVEEQRVDVGAADAELADQVESIRDKLRRGIEQRRGQADAAGNITRFADHVEFGAAINGESFGRWPNGQGELYPMQSLTLDSQNSGPRVGPVIISEVMYHPLPPTAEEFQATVTACQVFFSGTTRPAWTSAPSLRQEGKYFYYHDRSE